MAVSFALRQRFLGDLLAALERVLSGFFDAVDDLVGDLAEVLVLNPGRGKKHAGEEADCGASDR